MIKITINLKNKKNMKNSAPRGAKSLKDKAPRLKQKSKKKSAPRGTKSLKNRATHLKQKNKKNSTPQGAKSLKNKTPHVEQKSMKDLTPQDIRSLKNKVHHLKPVVIVGNKGLTDMVIQEIDRALYDHELMKIRIHTQNREELAKNITDICTKTNVILIHSIGHIIAIYRKNPDNEDN